MRPTGPRWVEPWTIVVASCSVARTWSPRAGDDARTVVSSMAIAGGLTCPLVELVRSSATTTSSSSRSTSEYPLARWYTAASSSSRSTRAASSPPIAGDVRVGVEALGDQPALLRRRAPFRIRTVARGRPGRARAPARRRAVAVEAARAVRRAARRDSRAQGRGAGEFAIGAIGEDARRRPSAGGSRIASSTYLLVECVCARATSATASERPRRARGREAGSSGL